MIKSPKLDCWGVLDIRYYLVEVLLILQQRINSSFDMFLYQEKYSCTVFCKIRTYGYKYHVALKKKKITKALFSRLKQKISPRPATYQLTTKYISTDGNFYTHKVWSQDCFYKMWFIKQHTWNTAFLVESNTLFSWPLHNHDSVFILTTSTALIDSDELLECYQLYDVAADSSSGGANDKTVLLC